MQNTWKEFMFLQCFNRNYFSVIFSCNGFVCLGQQENVNEKKDAGFLSNLDELSVKDFSQLLWL